MSNNVEIITVDATNIDEHGFFCYKSKPKAEGYQRKLAWLKARFAEGLVIKIVYDDGRSVGFIEYIPGEYAWRPIRAAGYMVIHCIWVVGRAKKKGYGSRLLAECVEDARRQQKYGVVMMTRKGGHMAGKKLFLKNGFVEVDKAPPAFELVVHKFTDDAPNPAFPTDWEARANRYDSGLTIIYADQCPYMADTVTKLSGVAAARGMETHVVELTNSHEARETAPSPYGVFSLVYNGKLLAPLPLSEKQLITHLEERAAS